MQKTLFGGVIIENIHDAREYFIRVLKRKRFDVKKVVPHNFGRHYGIIASYMALNPNGLPTEVIVKFYLVYQRRWFESFSKYYGVPDQAVSINLPVLVKVIGDDYDRIVWCNREGTLYMVDPKEMLRVAKEKMWIRKTEKTGETVVYMPLHKLKKITP